MSDLKDSISQSYDTLEETLKQTLERNALEQKSENTIQNLPSLEAVLYRADNLADVLQHSTKLAAEGETRDAQWTLKAFGKMVEQLTARANQLNTAGEYLVAITRLQQTFKEFQGKINVTN